MSRLVVDMLQGNAATGNKITIPAGHSLIAPGHMLQVIQTVKTDTWINATNNTYVEISGLIASITPKYNTSKILVCVNLGAVSAYSAAVRLLKNGSIIPGALGQTTGSRPAQTARGTYGDANHPDTISFMYLDSPNTTSIVNYSVGASSYGGYGFYLNRSVNDTDTADTYGGRTMSSITLMEIGG